MNNLDAIDRVMAEFIRYIDSGFGLPFWIMGLRRSEANR